MSSSVLSTRTQESSSAKPHWHRWVGRIKPALWLAPFALFFYLFQLAPMVWVLINSFIYDGEFAFDNYIEVLDSAFMIQAFNNSLWLAVWTLVVHLYRITFFERGVDSTRDICGFLLLSETR
ncbi:hypothetical protein [Vibrio sp. M250220]|uniref:hypothetical protein n=1 Tax=Vibrio sp. M250220 TaxID=3020894 RepID=UPI003FCDA877